MVKLEPSQLHALLDYNPDTGEFRWKPRSVGMFKAEHWQRTWNTRTPASPTSDDVDRVDVRALLDNAAAVANILFAYRVEGLLLDDARAAIAVLAAQPPQPQSSEVKS